MRISLGTTVIISRNIDLLDILVRCKIPVNSSIKINAVYILNSPHIVLCTFLCKQLIAITAKEKTTKLNVATNVKRNMTIGISRYHSSRVTTTIYISTDIRL